MVFNPVMLTRRALIAGALALAAFAALEARGQIPLTGAGPATRQLLPSWLPIADGVAATNFADYRTEGTTNRYWNSNAQQANAAAWWASRGTGGTFARASAKNVPAVGTGILTAFGSNLAAYTADPGTLKSLGRSYEGGRTNVAVQSNTFSNASWSKQAIGAPAQNATGPDGTTSAWTITANAGSNVHIIYQNATVTAGATQSFSFLAKAGTARYIFVDYATGAGHWASAVFDLSGTAGPATQTGTGATSGTIVSTSMSSGPNGFQQISLTASTASGTGGFFEIGFANGATGNSFSTSGEITVNAAGTETYVIADAQLEAASFPSSYIATTTGSVARALDNQSLTRGAAVTTIGKGLSGRSAIYAADANKFMWAISDGTANNYVGVYYNTSGHIIAEMNKAGSKTALDLGAVAVNTSFTVAFNAASGNLAASLNGGAVVSNAGAGALPAGLTNETEGQLNAVSQWFGTVEGSAEWASLSNAALIAQSGNSYWN